MKLPLPWIVRMSQPENNQYQGAGVPVKVYVYSHVGSWLPAHSICKFLIQLLICWLLFYHFF